MDWFERKTRFIKLAFAPIKCAKVGIRTDRAKRHRRLRNDGDARNRMYFYPFGVKRVLHQTTNNANMRADSGKIE
jgi:hypothetical protein